MDDTRFMQMALELAARGRGLTSPNPMVGAVVVKDQAVVGLGYHQAAGGPHAEAHAIDAAGEKARGGTLYVNLEPCNHTGRTPPCTLKIIAAGIRRVVIGMRDPNPTVAGGGAEFLERHGVEVCRGVCAAEAEALNEVFVKFIQTGRPFVIAKCAATLDGRIATRTGDSRWVTGAAARAFVHELRQSVDAIMVGVGTIVADDPQLTTRRAAGPCRDPLRVVLDTQLRIPPAARVLRHASSADTLVVTGPEAGDDAKRRIVGPGVQAIVAPLREDRIDLGALLGQLGQRGITSLLIEGGSRVLASAFREGVVDKACFFLAPLITGGDDGVPVCRGRGVARMQECTRLVRVTTRRFGDDTLIEGYVPRVRGARPEA
ncbi:MAG: bifunctional diaminohydroxyphosphoribosylaminopyrimidine deaminase/5-amino-6-(5-phosphoribosylamino)uracil reductase RibD [Desulfobacterales bacterium]|jgi:diaminohydroxyphosphoribosylaminopyrimidine deaminase/5-amino-6-(5-phosphoribosylamino)uracil reductase|nr:bifunctional diaminohydroxyphosphoribosylaminopyrimidine deaminase/5-amino-6-(5-phosphoribosylamino)uracil reductase RibD [Desulfobacterales bacterium]